MINYEDNYRILVVDDVKAIHDDFNKILLPEQSPSEQLESMHAMIMGSSNKTGKLPPFKIDSAFNGEEGVSLTKAATENKRPYAVAFVDVQMPPGMDGIDTIEKLWRLDSNIQIVICTAYAKYSWEDLQGRFGDTDHLFLLKKPFDSLEVIQLAISLTKRWNINRAVQQQLLLVNSMPKSKGPVMESAINDLKSSVEKLSQLTNKIKDKKETASPK